MVTSHLDVMFFISVLFNNYKHSFERRKFVVQNILKKSKLNRLRLLPKMWLPSRITPIIRARDDLTLFCDIYNIFFIYLIDFFVPNSNPMSASLKRPSIFVDSRAKVNFKVKYDFSRNKARNNCNTSFLCDFDWAIHF